MRLTPLVAIASLALLAGCSQTTPPPQDTAPAETNAGADEAAPAPAPAQPAPAAGTEPSAKIGADQVGKVSPVPAFKGFGEHWSIHVRAVGKMNHTVDLTWGSGSETASGMVSYDGPPPVGQLDTIVLRGELQAPDGAKPMTVEIVRKDCTDDGDVPHRHSVQVTVEGMAPMRGCGDLAVY